MPNLKAACFKHKGTNVILIVLDPRIGSQPQHVQSATLTHLQAVVNNAGLAGTAALVWQASNGRIDTFGPRQWSIFLRSLSAEFIARNINRTLSYT